MAVTKENAFSTDTYTVAVSPNTSKKLQTTISVYNLTNDSRPSNRVLLAFIKTLDHPSIPGKYARSAPSRVYYDSNSSGEIDLELIDSFSLWSNEYNGYETLYLYGKINPPRAVNKSAYVVFPSTCSKKAVYWQQFNGCYGSLDYLGLAIYSHRETGVVSEGVQYAKSYHNLVNGSMLFSFWETWKIGIPTTYNGLSGSPTGMTHITTSSYLPTRNAEGTTDSILLLSIYYASISTLSLQTSETLEPGYAPNSPLSIFSLEIMPIDWAGPFYPPWVDRIGDYVEVPCGYAGQVVSSQPDLSHLEGQVVSIYANGTVLPQQVVDDGTVNVSSTYSLVHIGLPFYSDLETLSVEVQQEEGTVQSKRKKISNVTFSFKDSRGGFIGPDENDLWEAFTAAAVRQGSGVNIADDDLFTGDIRQPLGGQYGEDGHVFFRQSDPLPVTIGAIIPEVEIGGRTR